MFAVENLTVRAGHASLLSGVSAWIAPGRVVAIAGPNGAGKSTLLSCLAGLRDADAGSVLLDGEALGVRCAAERARLIGYLPQEAALHWNISVRSLVSLGRYPHRHAMAGDTGEDERAIQIALAAAGLEALADRPVRTLSGGERARAMLARVLATEPAWILADEPLAALDIAHRHEIMHLLQGIAARGVGVVVVIHDLALARRTADEALLLDGGRLVAAGPVEDVLSPARLGPVFGVDFALVPAADGIETLVASPPLS